MNPHPQLIYLPWAIFFSGLFGTIFLGYRSMRVRRRQKEKEKTSRREHELYDRARRLLEEAENSSSLRDETREKIKELLHERG